MAAYDMRTFGRRSAEVDTIVRCAKQELHIPVTTGLPLVRPAHGKKGTHVFKKGKQEPQ